MIIMQKSKKILLFIISIAALICVPLFLRFRMVGTTLSKSDFNSMFSFSVPDGFYDDDITVEMSLDTFVLPSVEIHYTLDGNTPTSRSPIYSEPLSFVATDEAKAVTVKAIITNPAGKVLAGPYSADYFIKKDIQNWTDALIVEITSDDDGLFSEETGILYPAKDCGPTEDDWSDFKRTNCMQRSDEWIRDAHISIFEPDGTKVISQNVGLCVDGNHGSMVHYPFSLKVLAGKEYDRNNATFNYSFFPHYNTRGTVFPHLNQYNNIVFKNGGNEYNAGVKDPEQNGSMLRWSIGSRLGDEAGLFIAGSRPALVYLNGELYGATYIMDSYNRYNISSRLTLNKKDIEIYKGKELNCTNFAGFDDLYFSYPDVENTPLKKETNRSKFEQLVDIEDMFRYYAFVTLVNNTDFPKKNVVMWRYNGEEKDGVPYSDNLYRFIVNDLDCTYEFRYDDDSWTAYFNHIKEGGTLMGSCAEVPEYRALFINTLCSLFNTKLFDSAHMHEVIDNANNRFSTIANIYYSKEDEAQRQRNVANIQTVADNRVEDLRERILDSFSPKYPYTLVVNPPANGSVISFAGTDVIGTDVVFSGQYYGDYPLTLTYKASEHTHLLSWDVNGKKYTGDQITIDSSNIKNGAVTISVNEEKDDTASLCINEFTCDGSPAFVELYNNGTADIQLADFSLSCSTSDSTLSLPDAVLEPGALFIMGVDASSMQMQAGSTLALLGNNQIVDSVIIPTMSNTESYGRFGQSNEWRYFATPTPGEYNGMFWYSQN